MTCPDCDERARQDRAAAPYIKTLIWVVVVFAIVLWVELLRGKL